MLLKMLVGSGRMRGQYVMNGDDKCFPGVFLLFCFNYGADKIPLVKCDCIS